MKEERPLILITNDDGIYAKGLRELIDVMCLFGKVLVVAPERAMSGMSAAVTLENPIRVSEVEKNDNYESYKCTGTPADCVKAGFNLFGERPDYVVIGINHGPNSGTNIVYSGTMGATMEGCLHGVVSIGFSLCDFDADADFTKSKVWVARIFQKVVEKGLPERVCLNVNIPSGEIKGVEICRQTKGHWEEEFEKHKDPYNHDYYWLGGTFINEEPDVSGTDLCVLENQKITIVPVKVDYTSLETVDEMRKWEF